MSDDIQKLIKMTKELRVLSRTFAKFIVEFGAHRNWCGYRTGMSKSCTCGYGELFDATHKFLKETKDDSK